MKQFICIVFLLLLSISVYSQRDLNGVVSLHNSLESSNQIEYLSGVFVSAPLATHQESDVSGNFKLSFGDVPSSTLVEIQASKTGYEVVNRKELLSISVTRPHLVRIYMAKAGTLAEAQTRYYNISKKALLEKKNAEILALNSNLEISQLKIKEITKSLGQEIGSKEEAISLLEVKVEELIQRLPSFAFKLAEENLDFASDYRKNVHSLFLNGHYSQIVKLIDKDSLIARAFEAQRNFEAINNEIDVLSQTKETLVYELEEILDCIDLGIASALNTLNLSEALEMALKQDSVLKSGYSNLYRESEIYQTLGGIYLLLERYKDSMRYGEKELAIREQIYKESNRAQIVPSLYLLSLSASGAGDMDKAIQYTSYAIDILESLDDPDPADEALLYSTAGPILVSRGQYREAIRVLEKALKKLPENGHNAGLVDKPTILHNIGEVYLSTFEFEEAKNYFLECIATLENDDLNIDENRAKIIKLRALMGTAAACNMGEENIEARQFVDKAILLNEELDYVQYADRLTVYYYAGLIYMSIDVDLAINYFNLALNLPRPVQFEQDLRLVSADLHRSLSLCYQNKKLVNEAIEHSTKAIRYSKDLGLKEDFHFGYDYLDLSRLYSINSECDSVIYYGMKAIYLLEPYVESNDSSPRSIGNLLSQTHNRIGLCYADKGEYEKSLIQYSTALDLCVDGSEMVMHNNRFLSFAKLNDFESANDALFDFEESIPDGAYHRIYALLYRAKAVQSVYSNKPNEAVDYIRLALDNGYPNYKWLLEDDLLESLRQQPIFSEIEERITLLKNSNH